MFQGLVSPDFSLESEEAAEKRNGREAEGRSVTYSGGLQTVN